ncbi:MAG: PfkB family carbohydrate kinase [Oscillospiraceae bacterium]|nr:PfkB family carbohydrate kinase [Oscillospiraceae bacterium]
MVVTVTLNPAVDVTARIGSLRPGQTNRLDESTVNAGGKGVNAARMIKELGGNVIAVGFADALFVQKLHDLEHRFYETAQTRINMKVIDSSGGMTELNSPGAPVGTEAHRWLEQLFLELCVPGTIFVLSGSLPPDSDPGLYARYIHMLHEKGAKIVLDASGEALRLGAAAKPYVIKPNRDEMAMIGNPAGFGLLANSLDSEGARFYANGKEWTLPALPVEVVSPAGAGDCMVGALAFALDQKMTVEEAARLSMACAAASVMTPGTGCPPLGLIKKLLNGYA